MDGNNRIMHRVRPRPYDLRRKVLLKNFLREQMTYIPPIRGLIDTSIEVGNNIDVSSEESTLIGNEENIETSDDQPKHTHSDILKSEPIPLSSSAVMKENEQSSENSLPNISTASVASESDKIPQSKFSRLSTLLRFKSVSKKRKKRGIAKAKHSYKAIKNPVKITSEVPDTTKDSETPVRCKKSFFSLFKSRREKRKINIKNSQCSSVEPSIKTSATSDQSIQTDISLFNETYNQLEQTNKCLQEENKLLSESLSYIMSDINFKLNSKKQPFEYMDSYSNTTTTDIKTSVNREQNLSEPIQTFEFKDYTFEPSGKTSRNKLLRSNSVQERSSNPKIYLRTKSNEYPETSKIFNTRSKLSGFNTSYSNRSKTSEGVQNLNRPRPHNFNQQSILKILPMNSSKTLVRRSSMPERTSRAPIRPFLRPRSNSSRVINYNPQMSRKPNHNASCSRSDRPFVPKKTITSVGKPIVRRSSMPERISRSHYKPVYRHKSINGHDFSSMSKRSCSRPNSVGEYSRSVSFQNLPNEAFY